jgi:hypothetical protein
VAYINLFTIINLHKNCFYYSHTERSILSNRAILTASYDIKDRIINIGSGTKKIPIVTARLVEVLSGKTCHSYLTGVLDSQILPPYVVADLE